MRCMLPLCGGQIVEGFDCDQHTAYERATHTESFCPARGCDREGAGLRHKPALKNPTFRKHSPNLRSGGLSRRYNPPMDMLNRQPAFVPHAPHPVGEHWQSGEYRYLGSGLIPKYMASIRSSWLEHDLLCMLVENCVLGVTAR